MADHCGSRPFRVVITGASAGVGRAVAEEFAAQGWHVGLIARGRAGLEGARAAVERRGAVALTIAADVADAQAVDRAAEEVVAAWGGIDIWINAAMATVLAPSREVTPEEFRRVTEVTYLGQVFGTMAAVRQMSRQGHGTIVSIGSALAYRGIPLQAPYCAAKFAVRGFLDSLRAELLHDGSPLRVTEVHLPAVDTPQFDWARNKMPHRPQPVPPIYSPQAIAVEVYRAAMEAPREVWLAGSAVKAILGDAAAPTVVDRVLAGQAYSGQQTDQAAESRRDNLFDPVDDLQDHGANGRFGDRARTRVRSIRPARLRAGAAAVAVGLVAGGVIALLKSDTREGRFRG
ncbi:MAG: SDR family oxidoreductase [Paracoccus sp. (in: a-proteobacteria)]|uniref:SDR family oxidoreductase n=1 Tax=Paracoccus sp. TaxID=267 RepID=UPI004059966E